MALYLLILVFDVQFKLTGFVDHGHQFYRSAAHLAVFNIGDTGIARIYQNVYALATIRAVYLLFC